MPKSSRFADAVYEWLKSHAPNKAVPTNELWQALEKTHPELTTATEKRKTPRTTCMRDLRVDKAKRFIVANRMVRLSE